ncbi:MAG: phage major capsid protein [Butyricimonas virosa]|nr:phage major capsid protein [Butyricimonas virosa]
MKNLINKVRKCSKVKMFAFVVLAMIGVACVFCDAGSMMAMTATAPFIALVKKDAGLSEEEESFLKAVESPLNEAFDKFSKGFITREELDEVVKKSLTEFVEQNRDKMSSDGVKKSLDDIQGTIKSIVGEIQKMKDGGITLGNGSMIEKAIDEIIDNPKMVDFINSKSRTTGKIPFNIKGIVSLENNYEGNLLTTQQTGRVIVDVNERRINVRDLMTVDQGDPEFTSIAYAKIVDLDRNAVAVSENGRLPESAFKMKEETANISRIGTHVNISKRLLKSRPYLRSFLMNRLPKWVKMAEDFQILFGDGTGDNLLGIVRQSNDISKWLTAIVAKGETGSVESVESYDKGEKTMITFSKPFDKIEEGMLIKFTGAPEVTGGTASKLNSENMMHKHNDRKIMIDVPYADVVPQSAGKLSPEEIKALTFEVKNNFFNTVEDPNYGDAINAVIAVLTYGEFTPNMVALNPSDVFMIQTLKDTSGRSLDLITGMDGTKRISGRVIVETTIVPPGYYFIGDMANAAALVDYTSLFIEFAEDIESKLTNQVTVIAQEEVLMPVYNPYAFAYGKLDDVLAAITKKKN